MRSTYEKAVSRCPCVLESLYFFSPNVSLKLVNRILWSCKYRTHAELTNTHIPNQGFTTHPRQDKIHMRRSCWFIAVLICDRRRYITSPKSSKCRIKKALWSSRINMKWRKNRQIKKICWYRCMVNIILEKWICQKCRFKITTKQEKAWGC